MAAGDGSSEPGDDDKSQSETRRPPNPPILNTPADESEQDEDEDEEEEEEPRLKYATLTRNVSSIYRNGDATSAFHVAGDKMAS